MLKLLENHLSPLVLVLFGCGGNGSQKQEQMESEDEKRTSPFWMLTPIRHNALIVLTLPPRQATPPALHKTIQTKTKEEHMLKRNALETGAQQGKSVRQPRIERGAHRWQRWILPLNH